MFQRSTSARIRLDGTDWHLQEDFGATGGAISVERPSGKGPRSFTLSQPVAQHENRHRRYPPSPLGRDSPGMPVTREALREATRPSICRGHDGVAAWLPARVRDADPHSQIHPPKKKKNDLNLQGWMPRSARHIKAAEPDQIPTSSYDGKRGRHRRATSSAPTVTSAAVHR